LASLSERKSLDLACQSTFSDSFLDEVYPHTIPPSKVDLLSSLIACHYAESSTWHISIEENRPVAIEASQAQPGQADWTIAPGLCDLQINGLRGFDFSDATLSVDAIHDACRAVLRDGVTSFMPTFTTNSSENLSRAMNNVATACRENQLVGRMVLGFHLEGPYISAEDGPRGAHPKVHCRPPQWEEFAELQDAAEGNIRLVTLSPEYDEAIPFIERATKEGIRIAIGHTAASETQIFHAVQAGATLSTHLGNGAHGVMPRHPNYIWDQLATDRLVATLIADGFHLPAGVMRCFWRIKGPQRTVLVSDTTLMSGKSPGVYDTTLGSVEVLEDGRLVVAGQRTYLAGATLPLLDCIPRFHHATQASMAQSWDAASVTPRQLFEPKRFKSCDPTKWDELVVYRNDETNTRLEIAGTLIDGQWYGKSSL